MPSTVLFVDDEAPVLRSLKREFSIMYDLTVAYSAEEAQSLLNGPRSFDAVVSDVTMPGMNGLDFVAQAAPRNPHTSFVILTGNCDSETLVRAEAMPTVARVLTKPASREQILSAIDEAVGANQPV